MATYTVYLPPEEWTGDPNDGFKLLPDGKSPLALIFPPFWLAWHRLWLPLLAYVVVTFAIVLLAAWKPGAPVAYLSALPGLYLLLEGTELIRGKYERKGWRYAGIVEGDTKEEAEIRFITSMNFEEEPVVMPSLQHHAPVKSFAPPKTANVGLFPE